MTPASIVSTPTPDCDGIQQVQSIIARVAHDIDRKHWPGLRSLYADEVETDYTSLFGGTAQRQRGDDLIDGWRTALAAVSTQHLLGPIDVDLSGSAARAECHVCAWHHAAGAASGDGGVVHGHYIFALEKRAEAWRITAMTLDVLHQSGNTRLLQEASA